MNSEDRPPIVPSYEYTLVRHDEGERTGFELIRVEDGEPTHPRGGSGVYRGYAKGVSNYRPALQKGDYDPGMPLTLVPEPDNPYDENAVAIWDRNRRHKVGYIPRGSAQKLSPKIRAGGDIRGYVLHIDRYYGGRAKLNVLVVDMDEASIGLPDDPVEPLRWEPSGGQGCLGAVAILGLIAAGFSLSLVFLG